MIKDKEAKNLGTLCILLVAGLLVSQQLLEKKKGKKKGKTERGGEKKEELNHLRPCELWLWLKEKPEISFLHITVGFLKPRLPAVNNKFNQKQLTHVSKIVQKI